MRILIVIILVLLPVWQNGYSYEKGEKKTGTFTSLFYHEKAGDLLGYEIRIVYTRNGYEGTFQSAEGGPDRLILVNRISIKDDSVEFLIPANSDYEGEFRGRLIKNGLVGKITLKNGNTIDLNLKRGKSYWD
jgi:hypothetical protein